MSDQIVDILHVDRCAYRPGRPVSRSRINPDGSVTRDNQPIDVYRSGLPTDDEIEILVQNNGQVLGRFLLVRTNRVVWPTPEERRVAVAEQAGAALAAPGSAE